MADECNASEIVTVFLLNTCGLPPSISRRDLQAAMWCIMVSTCRPTIQREDDEEAEFIPLVTGGVAEFYIEPMLPHVGDIDVMFHYNTWLAIPRGHSPPTQLPAEFHNYVRVYEIIDSHLPGYVYLRLRYLLAHILDDGRYNIEYVEEVGLQYALNGAGRESAGAVGLCPSKEVITGDTDNRTWYMHGPAVLTDNSNISQLLSVDSVHCVG